LLPSEDHVTNPVLTYNRLNNHYFIK